MTSACSLALMSNPIIGSKFEQIRLRESTRANCAWSCTHVDREPRVPGIDAAQCMSFTFINSRHRWLETLRGFLLVLLLVADRRRSVLQGHSHKLFSPNWLMSSCIVADLFDGL